MVGGAPQNALAIAEGLRRDRYEVSIACGRGEPSEEGIADRAEAVGIPVHIIRVSRGESIRGKTWRPFGVSSLSSGKVGTNLSIHIFQRPVCLAV